MIILPYTGPSFVDYLLVRKLTVMLILSDFFRMSKRNDEFKRKTMELFLGESYVSNIGAIRYDALLNGTKLE